jgi:hypothetical protein
MHSGCPQGDLKLEAGQQIDGSQTVDLIGSSRKIAGILWVTQSEM